MAWPVARPAEEVGVLTTATFERAAPKDRPPLFLEGGINRWAFAFLSDLSVWRGPRDRLSSNGSSARSERT
jgi:hypothetical protein